MCEKCGTYRGRKIIDMTAVVATKVKKENKKAASVK